MSSKTNETRNRAKQLASGDSRTKQAASREERPAQSAAPRAKPVRVSADLSPRDYRALTNFCGSSAEVLGRAKVNNVEALRALVEELGEDENLQARIRARIAANSDK